MKSKTIDIVSVGELLIDMISIDFADKMDEVENFKRIVGGSPANLAMNMHRLGKNVRLVSTVGRDDMGNFLIEYVKKLNLDTSLIRQTNVPTTLILVSRSKNVSNFEAYRCADKHIAMRQMSDEVLSQTAIFHTTCFALSQKPAQTNILRGAKRAVELGCQLSIDANYAPKIWENRAEAQRIVAEYCSQGAYVKISEEIGSAFMLLL